MHFAVDGKCRDYVEFVPFVQTTQVQTGVTEYKLCITEEEVTQFGTSAVADGLLVHYYYNYGHIGLKEHHFVYGPASF